MTEEAGSWVDVHLHLTDGAFRGEEEAIVRRARDAGVAWMVTAGTDLESSRRAVELARRHPGRVWAAVGVHPHEARLWETGSEAALEALAEDPRVVAVGEIGLDFHYDHSPRDVQERVFRLQLRLARRLGLPVVVHSREAAPETLAALQEEGAGEGLLHCFHGDAAFARAVLDLGFHLSVGGMLTFPPMEGLRRVVAGLPRERVCLETDAPYLAPVPHRGRRNEPAWITESGRALAALWGMTLLEAARLTGTNARRLFRRIEGAARTGEA